MTIYKCDYCGKELKPDNKKTLYTTTVGNCVLNKFDLHKKCFEKSVKEIDKIFDKSKEID